MKKTVKHLVKQSELLRATLERQGGILENVDAKGKDTCKLRLPICKIQSNTLPLWLL